LVKLLPDPEEVTTNETLALCASVPLVPEMVTVYVPAVVEFNVVRVSVELPEVEIEVGEKLAVTPVGRPEAARETVPVNPFRGLTLAENVVEFPAATVCEEGEAEKLKSGVSVTAFTVTLTLVLWTRLSLVPVMVRV
jgi:hypothetical protein